MTHHATYFTKTIFLATCLTLGCTSSGVLGCGSSDSGPTVDSTLLGVYQVSRYQGTGIDNGCDEADLTDIETTSHFVIYSFVPNDNMEEALLGGVFCLDVEDCRARATAAGEPTIGWSFTEGSDAAGWLGWGISSAGPAQDQCRAEVQAHVLTANGDTVGIETKKIETIFEPMIDGNDATCANRDALIALQTPNLPCLDLLVLEATLETNL